MLRAMITGQIIKETRERVGESQAQFAARFGVNQSTVHRWEAEGPPSTGTARIVIEQVVSQLAETEV